MLRGLIALAFITLGLLLMRTVHFRWEPAEQPDAIRRHAMQHDLVIPIAGVRAGALVDTYTQARESGLRPHDAIDILAPLGTPVITAARGRIEKIFISERGGKTIYQRSVDGKRVYYYAHLDVYRPGLREGMTVNAGTYIATVGATGNADPTTPHLHFAINRMAPGERWYEGTPVNPYPLLARSRVKR